MTGTRPPSPAATPTTIASSALPPRVRRVLQNLYDHIATDFIAALNAMLVEFEQQLFTNEAVRADVLKKTGVQLDWEIRRIGRDA